jgi:hypothetical protein
MTVTQPLFDIDALFGLKGLLPNGKVVTIYQGRAQYLAWVAAGKPEGWDAVAWACNGRGAT